MEIQKLEQLKEQFEQYVNDAEGVEYWLGRELQILLEYTQWRNFEAVINKAKIACETSGEEVINHFLPVEKEVKTGIGQPKKVPDYMLTRYACYLIAQNGDPRKEVVAFAQAYFAVQTRRAEVIQEQMELQARMEARQLLRESEKALSEEIYHRGVDNKGFAYIRSKGDQALFGNRSTQKMKEILGAPKSRPLADFLPRITISAKQLAADLTTFHVKNKDLQGVGRITSEHVNSNQEIRTFLIKQGVIPENLPPAEDIKKLERRVKRKQKNPDRLS